MHRHISSLLSYQSATGNSDHYENTIIVLPVAYPSPSMEPGWSTRSYIPVCHHTSTHLFLSHILRHSVWQEYNPLYYPPDNTPQLPPDNTPYTNSLFYSTSRRLPLTTTTRQHTPPHLPIEKLDQPHHFCLHLTYLTQHNTSPLLITALFQPIPSHPIPTPLTLYPIHPTPFYPPPPITRHPVLQHCNLFHLNSSQLNPSHLIPRHHPLESPSP